MSQIRRKAPQVESLEGKQLLTAMHVAALRFEARAQAAHVAPAPVSLQGELQMPIASISTFKIGPQNLGMFRLHGRLGTMGRVNGTFVAALDANKQYMSSGEMVLSNGRGKVTLAMTSDPANITAYDYTVVSGTRAFAGASGAGKMATAGVTDAGRTMLFTLTPG